jgi:hypothetical protein
MPPRSDRRGGRMSRGRVGAVRPVLRAAVASKRPASRRAASRRAAFLTAALAVALPLVVSTPRPASGQLTEPCDTWCAVLLGANAFTFATGASVAVGRGAGGFQTVSAGGVTWGASFGAVVAGGAALSGDGHRQRRAVRGAAVGAAGGALAGLALESLTGSTTTTRFAATLMGAAAGVVVGGVVGALTHEGTDSSAPPTPAVIVRIPF